MILCPPSSTLFPYTTLFRSGCRYRRRLEHGVGHHSSRLHSEPAARACRRGGQRPGCGPNHPVWRTNGKSAGGRSEEHTSELQSHSDLVCRLLLEKKNKTTNS